MAEQAAKNQQQNQQQNQQADQVMSNQNWHNSSFGSFDSSKSNKDDDLDYFFDLLETTSSDLKQAISSGYELLDEVSRK